MKTLRRFLMRAASSTRRCDQERLREELEQHVALQTAENLRAGLSPVEARRRAVLKLGAVEAIKEHYRDEQGLPVLDSLVRDVRYGSRALWRSPGFAVVAVASLALGIGPNTTIFSVANAVLYRPLPFDDPDRLVVIHEQDSTRGSQRLPTLATMIEWQEQARSFEQIEAIVGYAETNTLSGEGAAERVRVQFLTPGAFSLLGVKPARGRDFIAEDALHDRSVIISDGLWQRRFAGAAAVLGQSIRVGDRPRPIVGVLPAGVWTAPWMQNVDRGRRLICASTN